MSILISREVRTAPWCMVREPGCWEMSAQSSSAAAHQLLAALSSCKKKSLHVFAESLVLSLLTHSQFLLLPLHAPSQRDSPPASPVPRHSDHHTAIVIVILLRPTTFPPHVHRMIYSGLFSSLHSFHQFHQCRMSCIPTPNHYDPEIICMSSSSFSRRCGVHDVVIVMKLKFVSERVKGERECQKAKHHMHGFRNIVIRYSPSSSSSN